MGTDKHARVPVVLLAAGRGERLLPLTSYRPKAMLEVGGSSLAERAVAELRAAGAGHVVAIGGHRAELLGCLDVELRVNERYASADNVYSLWLARDVVANGCLIVNSDVLFEPEVARRLIAATGTAVLCDDSQPPDGEAMKVVERDGRVVGLSKEAPPADARGEYIGLARVDARAGPRLVAILDRFVAEERVHVYYEDALAELARSSAVVAISVGGLAWIEIDDHDDLERARAEIMVRIEDPEHVRP